MTLANPITGRTHLAHRGGLKTFCGEYVTGLVRGTRIVSCGLCRRVERSRAERARVDAARPIRLR